MKTKHLNPLLLGVLAVAISGCTKLDTPAKVSLSIPATKPMSKVHQKGGLSAQALDGTVRHIIVNITGDGLAAPVFWEWDKCSDCQTQNAVPSQIEIEVPAGNKVVQLLAVYENATTGGSDLHYGDGTANVTGATEVSLALTNLNQSFSLKHGQISGRYLQGPNTGPTGTLLVKYKPTGKPAMIISKTSIVSGWFSAMILEGLSLTYTVAETQVDIFDNVSTASPAFTPATNVARVNYPTHYRQSGGGSQWRPEAPAVYIFGFWGTPADAAAKRVCYNTIEIDSQMNYRSSDPSGNPKLTFGTMSGSSYVQLQGGEGSNVGNCQPWMDTQTDKEQNIYANMMMLNAQTLDSSGGSQSSGLSGLFGIRNLTENRYNSVSYPSATQATVKLRLLPGDGTLAFSSFKAYRRITSQESHFNTDTVPCEELATTSKYAYSEVPISSTSVTGSTVAVTIPVAKSERSTTNVAICPVKDGKVFNAGVFLGSYSMKGKYLKWEFDSSSETNGNATALVKGLCHSVQFKIYEGNDQPTTTDWMGVNLSNLSASNGEFSESSNCPPASPPSGPSIAGLSNSSGMFFFKGTLATATVISATVDNPDITFDTLQTFSVATPVLVVDGPTNIVANTCYPMQYGFQSATGKSLGALANITPTIGTTGLSYVGGSPDCTTPQDINLFQNNPSATVYVQTAASGSFTLTDPTYGPVTKNLTVATGQAIVESIELSFVDSPLVLGGCHKMLARPKNRAGAYIPAPTSISFDLVWDRTMGSFYHSTSCSSSTTTSINFSPGYTEEYVYFKPHGLGSAQVLTVNSPTSPLPVVGVGTGTLGASVAVNTPVGSSYIALGSAPSFNGKSIVAESEFGAARTITLTTSPGAIIECSPNDGTYSVANCSGVLIGNVYQFTLADAMSNQQRYFRVQGSSLKTKFQPTDVYGNDFKVIGCDHIITGTHAFNAGTYTTNGTVSSRLCLASGAKFQGSCSGTGIVLAAGSSAIVGHTDGSSEIDAASCAATSAVSMTGVGYTDNSQQHYLANLKFSNVAGSGAAIDVNTVTSAFFGANFNIMDNDISITGGTGIRLYELTDGNCYYTVRNNKITMSGAGGKTGIDISNFSSGALYLDNTTITSTSQSGVGVKNRIISAIPGAFLSLNTYSYDGAGMAFSSDGNAPAYKAITNINRANIRIAGSTTASPAIYSGPFAQMILSTSKLTGAAGNTSMGPFVSVSNTDTDISGNIFTQFENFNFIDLQSGALLAGLLQNQFVYRGSATPTNAPLHGAGQSAVGANATPDHGHNLFCTANATPWSAILTYSSLHGSNLFSNANALSKCMKTSDVSTAGFCQSKCDP